jgi:hypothetical protein
VRAQNLQNEAQIRYVAWLVEDGCRLTNCQSGQERWGLLFQRAAEGKRGEEALLAIGFAYVDEMLTSPIRLPEQNGIYTSKQRSEIREVVRIG